MRVQRLTLSRRGIFLLLGMVLLYMWISGDTKNVNTSGVNYDPNYHQTKPHAPTPAIPEIDLSQKSDVDKYANNEDGERVVSEPQESPRVRLVAYEFDPLSPVGEPVLPKELSRAAYPQDEEGYYLVQFKGPIQSLWRQAMEAEGVKVFDYIPDYTFVVKMDGRTKDKVAGWIPVRWIGVLQPGYLVEPELLALSQLARATAKSPGVKSGGKAESITREDLPKSVDIYVILFNGEDIKGISETIKQLGGEITEVSDGKWREKLAVTINPEAVVDIANITGVRWIEFAPVWELHNNVAAGDSICDVKDVWDNHGLRGVGQVVGVCDTGLDQGSALPASLHDDFEDGSGGSRVVAIYDLVGDGASDVNSGHGTHVAGSVLGNGYRSGSTPSTHSYPSTCFAGMAPEAELVFQAVENNSTGKLTGIPANLNTLFNQARSAGAQIHTNSWGSSRGGFYRSSEEEVDQNVWDHKDFAILFSAGNDSQDLNPGDGVIDTGSLGSPAAAKNCITVGASENNRPSGAGYDFPWGTGSWASYFPNDPIFSDHVSDDPDGMAAFSSRGPCLDGRYKPDVVAPGTNIISTRSSMASGTLWGVYNTYYVYSGGTSMATPLVAGMAALVREFFVDGKSEWNIGTPSAALIKAMLINGAYDMTPGQYGTGSYREIPATRPNNVEGWGRVDLEDTLFPASPRKQFIRDISPGLSTGDEHIYHINVVDNSVPLNVTLVWSDYPGSSLAGGGLVNDLDLTLVEQFGTTHYPNNASQRGATSLLYYDDVGYEESWRWNASGYSFAVKFTPSSYPYTLEKVRFGMSRGSVNRSVGVYVRDDDGSGGLPGTTLFSTTVNIGKNMYYNVSVSGVNGFSNVAVIVIPAIL